MAHLLDYQCCFIKGLKTCHLLVSSSQTAEAVRSSYGTPAYVYDVASLKSNANQCLAFPNAFGLTVRFAMKSCPNAAILQLFNSMGLHIDASSGYEVRRAISAGIPASHISLSTQELPNDFAELLKLGVKINACSLTQLERIGSESPGHAIGLRVNPGLGSGGTKRTNVGGPSSSFGSGSDPAVWQRVSGVSLDIVNKFPAVTHLNLGGGYKVGRMKSEVSTDLSKIGLPVRQDFEKFAKDTGRKLHLEIEPGTFLVANVGSLVSTVQDIVSTGSDGHTFIKLDAGMTDLLRPSLYGAQHPIITIPKKTTTTSTTSYVVVGHCCESGDILTPASVEGCGAYVSGMSAKNYNSFPEAPEVLIDETGGLHLIRRRQSLEQIFQNEMPLPEALL
eukprot:10889-Heterococcus_DN1.PRE.2